MLGLCSRKEKDKQSFCRCAVYDALYCIGTNGKIVYFSGVGRCTERTGRNNFCVSSISSGKKDEKSGNPENDVQRCLKRKNFV